MKMGGNKYLLPILFYWYTGRCRLFYVLNILFVLRPCPKCQKVWVFAVVIC